MSGGGCLCGALRYELTGAPDFAGFCCCGDCRKATGSGYIGFLSYPRDRVRFSGPPLTYGSPSASGRIALRNSCPVCGGLVFGGDLAESANFTIYAGSLDDPSLFEPTMAIFDRDRPAWVVLPPDITVFETMPTG
jgi:hypothetical protein